MARRKTPPPAPVADDEEAAGPGEWVLLADALLQRAALVARIGRGRGPDPLAGLKTTDDDVTRLISELPGFVDHEATMDPELQRGADAIVEESRSVFRTLLRGNGLFAQAARCAGLDDLEAEVLAVLCAVEIDPRRQQLVGYLNDDVTQRRLTPWSLTELFAGVPAHLAIAPGRGLHRTGFVESPGGGPWASTPVCVHPAVIWWLAGDDSLPPELPASVEVISGRIAGLHTLVTAAGPDRVRRLQAAVGALKTTRYLVTTVPTTPAQWDALVRHATLADAGVVLEIEGDFNTAARDRVERTHHLAWALTSPTDLPVVDLPRRPWIDLPVAKSAASGADWQATLGSSEVAGYRLTAEQLDLVGRAASAMGGDVTAAVRRLASGHIDALATRLRPSRQWDDLVLEPRRMEQIREIAIRCRHRATVFDKWGFSREPSTGVVALFAGPSGTGKTMAAEVIAGDLGLDLYKIDVAALVSKYIGETEKNLSMVFDAAEASNVALFFDEADALFGKRTEVSDSHDRYANIEVSYLLQRVERYEGLVVLATNLLNNVDPAFFRRLHVVVEFPIPAPAERMRIWSQSMPAAAPVGGDLDLKFLADRFELPGGTIRNAVLTAAFLAADTDTQISMATLVVALQQELRKMGRLVSAADFGPYAALDGLLEGPSDGNGTHPEASTADGQGGRARR